MDKLNDEILLVGILISVGMWNVENMLYKS